MEEIDLNQKHIVIVGDSVAFGSGIHDKETLSYQLAKELKEFQVLNFSVPGYSIDQYYLTLKKHINKTNPALIVVVIFTGKDLQLLMFDKRMWFNMANGARNCHPTFSSAYFCWNFLPKQLIIEELIREKFNTLEKMFE